MTVGGTGGRGDVRAMAPESRGRSTVVRCAACGERAVVRDRAEYLKFAEDHQRRPTCGDDAVIEIDLVTDPHRTIADIGDGGH